jgi:hypothetical protein
MQEWANFYDGHKTSAPHPERSFFMPGTAKAMGRFYFIPVLRKNKGYA